MKSAIKRLTKSSKVINFNSVSEEAGVSKATLYNHSELKERIVFLRKQQQEKGFVNLELNEMKTIRTPSPLLSKEELKS